jgi:hypothetical protein
MNSVSAMHSALSLVQVGNSKLLEATQFLGSGNPGQMIDGFVTLWQAKNSIKAASVLMQTQQQTDDAILDIFA